MPERHGRSGLDALQNVVGGGAICGVGLLLVLAGRAVAPARAQEPPLVAWMFASSLTNPRICHRHGSSLANGGRTSALSTVQRVEQANGHGDRVLTPELLTWPRANRGRTGRVRV